MGNREDLLRAATQCLVDPGFGATTVRDIAARAGVSHAAIGYHFGSREALLTQALVAAVDDLARRVEAAAGDDSDAERRWAALLATLATDRDLWVAQLEAVLAATRSPEVRRHLVAGQQQGVSGLGGRVPVAVLVGLAVQAVLEPDQVPDVAEVLPAVRPQRG